ENGVVFVSVNYRLTPAVTHPAHVSDVAAAVRWVRDHAAEFGGDADQIVLMGHSAGCHLVTLVALDPRYLARVGLRPADLRRLVAWSGGAHALVGKGAAGGSYAGPIKKKFGGSGGGRRGAAPGGPRPDARPPPPVPVASV